MEFYKKKSLKNLEKYDVRNVKINWEELFYK